MTPNTCIWHGREWPAPACGKPTAYVLTATCCGFQVGYCVECCVDFRDAHAKLPVLWQCEVCGAENAEFELRNIASLPMYNTAPA